MTPLKLFSGINDTAENTMIMKFKISKGFQPQKIFLPNFSSVIHNAAIGSAVSMTTRKQL
jgi:hypothetical protein